MTVETKSLGKIFDDRDASELVSNIGDKATQLPHPGERVINARRRVIRPCHALERAFMLLATAQPVRWVAMASLADEKPEQEKDVEHFGMALTGAVVLLVTLRILLVHRAPITQGPRPVPLPIPVVVRVLRDEDELEQTRGRTTAFDYPATTLVGLEVSVTR